MRTDHEYREILILRGVRRDLIATLSGHDLDCVGNIMGIYRTSMKGQDPSAFAISHNVKEMSGSIEKAKVSLAEIRKQIDDAEFLGDTSAVKVQALTAIVAGLCDVLTMLICEAAVKERDRA